MGDYDWTVGYPWMNAAQVRGRLYHAKGLAEKHGVDWWLTEEAVEVSRLVGVEPPEGYRIDETRRGPTVHVAADPWSRGFYITALLVRR